MASPLIRSARQSELDDLALLEVQAGELFHSVGMSDVADHVPDQQALSRSQRRGLIWVAEEDGKIAGYIVAGLLGIMISLFGAYIGERIQMAGSSEHRARR